MKVHFFQHVPFEGPGLIKHWVDRNGFQSTVTRFFCNEKVPLVSDVDMLIVMGGNMSVNDEIYLPWLKEEKQFIRECIKREIPVLGVCLGAQLIANALGASVYPGVGKEIGWFPVDFTPEARRIEPFKEVPDNFMVFHWHGETFDLPPRARLLAYNNTYPRQGFIVGNKTIGLQFHIEMTRENIADIIQNCGNEIHASSGSIQSVKEILSFVLNDFQREQFLFRILNFLAGIEVNKEYC